jgi:Na+-driven multidrug efflux pump
VNTIWVSQAIGSQGMAAISVMNNFDIISRAFGFFLQVASSTMVSSLIGEGRIDEANQTFSDLLRLTVICGIICPAIFIPIVLPIVRWFGTSDETIELGMDYIIPNLGGTIVPCLFLLACGCLQGEGRSWLFSIVQIASMIGNMLMLTPFFLYVCKTGISGVSIAALIAEFIPAMVIIGLYYHGKFSIKPQLGGLFRKPSVYSWRAIKVGLSQLTIG